MATLKLLGLTPLQKGALVKLAEKDNNHFALIGSNGRIDTLDFSIRKIHDVAEALSSTPSKRKRNWQYLDLAEDLIEFDYTINSHGDLVLRTMSIQLETCELWTSQMVVKNKALKKAMQASTDWDSSEWTVDDYIEFYEDDVLYVLAATVILAKPDFFEDEDEQDLTLRVLEIKTSQNKVAAAA